MIRSLFRRLAAGPEAEAKASLIPAGRRVYVIGDVHGRLDLLLNINEQIATELSNSSGCDAVTVLLGDYIDRGPHSAGVLEFLSSGNFATPIVALRGNHEEVMLQFLDEASVLDSWRKFGGLETLHSYGVRVSEAMRGENYTEAQTQLLLAVPDRHREFLNATKTHLSLGDYYFCHAGVRPGVPLKEQTASDLLWIREEFLSYCGQFGKVVVHGHTPVEKPDVKPNRINIDTGAYASSNLTALVLEGSSQRFLTTRRHSQGRF